MVNATQKATNDLNDYVLPVSEVFVSPQGEGVYSGALMTFIRLAGCTVGKPYDKITYDSSLLPVYTEKCTLYDGREFACDTDYRVKYRMSIDTLLSGISADVRHVCITGGEPLMHKGLYSLITALIGCGKKVHIETSGTIPFGSVVPSPLLLDVVWVTVSPKKGVLKSSLEFCNEIKLLVDKQFDPTGFVCETLTAIDLANSTPTFLHPVNGEHTINAENMRLCRDWQIKYPQFRIGCQLHKALEMILKEHVR